MKKTLLNLLIFLLIFALTACTVPNEPTGGGGGGGSGEQGGTGDGGGGTGGDSDPGLEYTVRLTYNGEPFKPDAGILAQWQDGFTLRTAEFGDDGVARTTGLDGDFRVTLSEHPDGYAYNPNIYFANNDKTDVTIELHAVTATRGSGKDYYGEVITIRRTGVYCATITKKDQIVYYQFSPNSSGEYLIESWVDTVANNVNPILHIHQGSIAWKNPTPIIVDDGADDFTSNFRYVVKVDSSNISASGGGVVYAYGIKADITDGDYPVKVYFSLTYEDTFSAETTTSNIIVPKELDKVRDYAPGHEYGAEYTFVGAAMKVGGQNIFEDDNYRLNPATGFYHLYNETAYADSDGFGPILYANISSPTIFTDAPFTMIEAAGNKALTVENSTQNYKLFIEGIGPLLVDPGANNPAATTGPYLCNRHCPCRTSGMCNGACALGCTSCLADCRQVPAEGLGCVGYAGVANSDGRCPVTAELMDFLQKFAVSQRYFMDGNGWAEIQSTPPYHAGEDDQWLFACGYYVEQ